MIPWKLALTVNIWLVRSTVAKNTGGTASCNADSIPKPEYFGTSVTNIQAKEVKGWGAYGLFGWLNAVPPTDSIDFCNITVTYTHPGWNDEVNVYVWLPLEGWNERFIAQGGGGFATGAEGRMKIGMFRFVTHAFCRRSWPFCPGRLRSREHRRRSPLHRRPLQSIDGWVLGPVKSRQRQLAESSKLRLRSSRRHGRHRQSRHYKLLRQSPQVLLLERLQHGRQTGHDAGSALPEEL